MSDTLTYSRFVKKHALSIKAQNVSARFPARSNSDWDSEALHFAVTMTAQKGSKFFVAWQGCYSVGSSYPIQWIQDAAKSKSQMLKLRIRCQDLRLLMPSLAQIKDLSTFSLRRTVNDAGVLNVVNSLYKDLAPLDPAGVLESLRMDCEGVAGSTFEDWASDLGMDTDSRSALAMFEQCRATSSTMLSALGADGMAELFTVEE